MADPQDQPNSEPEGESTPPAKKPPAKAAKKAANPPAKKAPAKKAPAKKAPAKAQSPAPAPPKPAEQPPGLQQRIETNGDLAAAAKDAAAQAKSTVEDAQPVSSQPAVPPTGSSPLPLVVALALSLLAILLIRQLRRR
ncbi:MAG: hypothetical protein QOH91_3133 [Mycobacterium sp.]|jgi:hypothetical protein|nr:hypothetical protein [Mycobacterium sp.]